MAKIIGRTETAITPGEMLHGTHMVLTRHVLDADRWRRSAGDVIGKDRKGSMKKMGAAVGMCLTAVTIPEPPLQFGFRTCSRGPAQCY
ncbi:hypothetical protein SRABI44_02119 [Microbacterium foliorum]|nr:hypothetical protein SRABI03_00444 [Microbacterium foliorum]CAH0208927.1 hypothetical protein SRABI44_02119 [Microbacterium foliorum]